MTKRALSPLDQLLVNLDRGLRTLGASAPAPARKSPARTAKSVDMTEQEKRHAAGLMRVNHTGEVCAQALYQGQALTAKLPQVRQEMEHAAAEEIDHLAWCEQRIVELGSQPSMLNPVWYSLSFAIGATAGLISDKLSLGFVAATEDQVCEHLQSHLQRLPEQDEKSRAVVEQMLADEAKHAHMALEAGGTPFPAPVKKAMSLASKLMTETSYRI